MRLFHKLEELPANWGESVASIGNFDGVHRAHQLVLRKVVERARDLNVRSMAVTFDPHPLRVLRPDGAPSLITPLPQKLAAFREAGISAVLVLPFTAQFASTSPAEFARRVVVEGIHAKELHEGANFHFGHRAEGSCETLKALGRELGFEVVIYPEMRFRGETVSSSRVRQLLLEGNVNRARHLLDRPFSVVSTPAKGRGYGSRYTVPTINLAPYSELVPKNGVYVTCTRLAGETFESVTNVGTRPTFEDACFAIETHLLNFHTIDLDENTEVEIAFLKWLRPEIQWPNAEALKEQIGKDIRKAKRFFALLGEGIGSRADSFSG